MRVFWVESRWFFNQPKFIGGSKLLCAKISENLAACLEEFSVLWEKSLQCLFTKVDLLSGILEQIQTGIYSGINNPQLLVHPVLLSGDVISPGQAFGGIDSPHCSHSEAGEPLGACLLCGIEGRRPDRSWLTLVPFPLLGVRAPAHHDLIWAIPFHHVKWNELSSPSSEGQCWMEAHVLFRGDCLLLHASPNQPPLWNTYSSEKICSVL